MEEKLLERTRAYYDAHAESLEKRKLSCELDAEETQSIVRSVPANSSSLLDVGCGTGHLLEKGPARFKVGIDSSVAMLRIAHRLTTAHLVLGDARRLLLRGCSFDAVTCQDVVGHFRDPAPVVVELLRACNPVGLVVITAPKSSLFSYMVSAYSRVRLRVYLRSYSREELEKIFEVSGGSVISAEVIGRSILKLLAAPRTPSRR